MRRIIEGSSPAFFKVLIGDFTEKLRIPPAFTKNIKSDLSKKFKLEVDAGKSWQVNMKRVDQYYFFLGYGWRKFVRYLHLEAGDFIVFWLTGDSKFEVVPFEKSGCRKDLNLAFRKNEDVYEENKDVERSRGLKVKTKKGNGVVETAGFAGEKHPRFEVILKGQHKYTIYIPLGFAIETGVAWRKAVMLKDPEGRMWAVDICIRTTSNRIDIARGWSNFVRANKLAYGDTCLFQFVRGADGLIDVQILRSRGGGRETAESKPRLLLGPLRF